VKFAALLLLCCALPAAAQDLPPLDDMLPEPTRYLAGYVTGAIGNATPFGGHWGDKSSGFKTSGAFSLSASRRVDEVLSYGGEIYSAGSHANRQVKGLGVKVFSLSPFVRASFPSGNKTYYGLLGAGVYQWRSEGYTAAGTRYPSESGSSAGVDAGVGVSIPFWFGTRAGLDLRWRHIFNMNGAALDLGAVDTYNVMFALHYNVWKEKKKTTP